MFGNEKPNLLKGILANILISLRENLNIVENVKLDSYSQRGGVRSQRGANLYKFTPMLHLPHYLKFMQF